MIISQSKPSTANWLEELCPKIKKGYYKAVKFQGEFI